MSFGVSIASVHLPLLSLVSNTEAVRYCLFFFSYRVILPGPVDDAFVDISGEFSNREFSVIHEHRTTRMFTKRKEEQSKTIFPYKGGKRLQRSAQKRFDENFRWERSATNSYDQKQNTAKGLTRTSASIVHDNCSIAFNCAFLFPTQRKLNGVSPRKSQKQERALKIRAAIYNKRFPFFPRYLLKSGLSISTIPKIGSYKYNHGLRESPRSSLAFPQLKQFNLGRLRILGPVHEYTRRCRRARSSTLL